MQLLNGQIPSMAKFEDGSFMASIAATIIQSHLTIIKNMVKNNKQIVL
jgi:hypothetical protein